MALYIFCFLFCIGLSRHMADYGNHRNCFLSPPVNLSHAQGSSREYADEACHKTDPEPSCSSNKQRRTELQLDSAAEIGFDPEDFDSELDAPGRSGQLPLCDHVPTITGASTIAVLGSPTTSLIGKPCFCFRCVAMLFGQQFGQQLGLADVPPTFQSELPSPPQLASIFGNAISLQT